MLSWNLQGSRRVPTGPVAGAIAAFAPDVVALQEVRRGQARKLARALGMRVTWVLKHNPFTRAGWWLAEGMAILTAHDLDVGKTTVLSHGRSVRTFRRRIMHAASIGRDAATLDLFNVHLEGVVPTRVEQAGRAAEAIVAAANDGAVRLARTVVAGDLNAPDDPDTLAPFLRLGLADPGGSLTSPAVSPIHRVDFLLVPEAAEIVSLSVVVGGQPWASWSDHLPAVVTFSLPGEPATAPAPP